MIKPRLFLKPSVELDLESSLDRYKPGTSIEQFSGVILESLKNDKITKCDIHSFKSGAFGIVLKIMTQEKEAQKNYFLKFYRNKTALAEYTTDKMKDLCRREYLTLKAAHSEFSAKGGNIDVAPAVAAVPELACFITQECPGREMQRYLGLKTKMAFLNPLNLLNNQAGITHLDWCLRQIAELLARIHELKLDHDSFKESRPFHVLDFEYKKKRFLENLQQFNPLIYQELYPQVERLTQEAKRIFPSLEPTGLAIPDTNLTNFIISEHKICMLDFFLIQHGPCYQPLGKFIACFELILYPFISKEQLLKLKQNFIEHYETSARQHRVNRDILEFFINWNYMTFMPHYRTSWKYFHQKWIFQRKITFILQSWQNSGDVPL